MPNQIDMPPMPAERNAAGRPWGFWATLGWTLLAFTVGALAVVAVGAALARWDTSLTLSQMLLRRGHGPVASSLMILACGVVVAVLALAAKRSGWSAVAYLALVRPRGRYVLFGLLCGVLPFLFTLAHAQFDISQFVPPEDFGRARGANILHVQFFALVIMVVIAMPVMEEIVFRGFLYRGLSETRLGVAGTIIITAVVFGLVHPGKGPAGMFDTAVHGVAWGWLRWYTGSTLVPIASHVANNGIGVLLTVAALYGWFG